MPQLVQETVKAQSLRIGDSIVDSPSGGYAEVISKDVKTKWTYLELGVSEGLNVDARVLNDAEFVVEREVPTPEEEAAAQLRHTLRSLDFKEANDRKNLAAAREKMLKDLQEGARATHWSWMDVPFYEAVVTLWDAVAHVHKVRALEEDEMTRVDAVRFVLEQRTKKALSYYSALSRSTSTVSNLFEDIEREALSRWARELEWVIV